MTPPVERMSEAMERHNEMVYGVCRRLKEECHRCPPEEQSPYGPGTRACYAQAEEICQFVKAALASERDGERWREHCKLMKEGTMPDALHMRLTMNEGGKVWNIEYILDAGKFGRNTVLGIKAIGLAAEQKAQELFAAIESGKEGK